MRPGRVVAIVSLVLMGGFAVQAAQSDTVRQARTNLTGEFDYLIPDWAVEDCIKNGKGDAELSRLRQAAHDAARATAGNHRGVLQAPNPVSEEPQATASVTMLPGDKGVVIQAAIACKTSKRRAALGKMKVIGDEPRFKAELMRSVILGQCVIAKPGDKVRLAGGGFFEVEFRFEDDVFNTYWIGNPPPFAKSSN